MLRPNRSLIKILPLLSLSLLSLFLYAFKATHWKYGLVGDELPFYRYAVEIANRNFLFNPFFLSGAYPQERALGSFWQALFIKCFGENVFAWRLSNIVLAPIFALLLHTFVCPLFGRSCALMAAFCVSCSYFLINFTKIGYPHPLSLVFFLLCLIAANRARRAGDRNDYITLGLTLGISFYTYMGPAFPAVIIPALLLAKESPSKTDFSHWLWAAIAYAAVVGIGFASTPAEYWLAGAHKTILFKEFAGLRPMLFNIGRNFLLFFFSYDYLYNHFVSGASLDRLSQIFATVGILFCCINFRNRNCRFLLTLWIMLCIVWGVINPYKYIPSTRVFYFIPFGATFAALGIYRLSRLHVQQRSLILGLTFVSILILNMYRAHIGVFLQIGHSQLTALLRTVLAVPCSRAQTDCTIPMIYFSSKYLFPEQDFYTAAEIFGVSMNRFSISRSYSEICGSEEKTFFVFSGDRGARVDIQEHCPNKWGENVVSIDDFSPGGSFKELF